MQEAEAVDAEQRFGGLLRLADVQTLAIAPRAAAFGCVVHLGGGGEVSHAGDAGSVFLQADQHRPGARVANKVARTVDGIDDPLAAVGCVFDGAFFAQQAVVGERVAQDRRR